MADLVRSRPVVFLDMDGVLLPFGNGAHPGPNFPDECLTALSRLLEASGAQIVLSSTWRCNPSAMQFAIENFQRFARIHGGPLGQIDGFHFTTSTTNHSHRQWEIAEWLRSPVGRNVRAWVVLDDEEVLEGRSNATNRPVFEGHVVKTQSEVGLTVADADVAIGLFKRGGNAVSAARQMSSRRFRKRVDSSPIAVG